MRTSLTSFLFILIFISTDASAKWKHQSTDKKYNLYETFDYTLVNDNVSALLTNAWQSQFKYKSVTAKVVFGVDRLFANPTFAPDKMKIKLNLEISVKKIGSNGIIEPNYTSTYKEVIIEYDPAHGVTERDAHALTFDDVHDLRIQIEDIYVDVGMTGTYTQVSCLYDDVCNSSGQTYPDVYLQSFLDIERIDHLDPGQFQPSTMVDGLIIQGANSCDDKREVIWDEATECEYYELEWSFLDYKTSLNLTGDHEINLQNNVTRIITTDNSFKIPIIYNQGFVYFRYRPVGYDIGTDELVKGPWSSNEVHSWPSSGYQTDPSLQILQKNYFYLPGFNEQLNWQYSISFAEEAKNKGVIVYADGSLRGRQSITKLNSIDVTLVGQSIYDWYGRATINVLPTPVQESALNNLCFKANFTPANNTNQQYSWKDFDIDNGDICADLNVNRMSTNSGASKYYSNQNYGLANGDEFAKTIPDAEGYPFSMVEFTDDQSGRVKRQGGLGIMHRLSGKEDNGAVDMLNRKETVLAYGVPTQSELDRLFGSDVGNYKYYRKQVTRDANGQLSLTFIDQYGRTIATALTGDPSEDTPNLDPLASSSVSYQLSDNFENNEDDVEAGILVASHTYPVTYKSDHSFSYQLDPKTLTDACVPYNMCFDCVYDLTISILDECSNQLIPGGQITQTVGNINPFDTDCESPVTFSIAPPAMDMELPQGTYRIEKRLSVNKEAMLYYENEFVENNVCLKNYDYFESKYLAEMSRSDCDFTCDDCNDQKNEKISELANVEAFIQNPPGGTTQQELDEKEARKIYLVSEIDDLEDFCDELCNAKNQCEILLEQILSDVSPNGQYARYFDEEDAKLDNPISWLKFPSSILNEANGAQSWRSPKWFNTSTNTVTTDPQEYFYMDQYGNKALIKVNYAGLPVGNSYVNDQGLPWVPGEDKYVLPHQLTNVEDFIYYWKDSWALSLIHLHPELCLYQKCHDVEDTYDYDVKLILADAQSALTQGFFNPLDQSAADQGLTLSTSVQINFASNQPFDPILNTSLNITALKNKLKSYEQQTSGGTNYTYSIWQMYMEYVYNATGSYAMADCYNDLYWPYFRAMYLSAKQDLLAQHYVQQCPSVNITGTRRFVYSVDLGNNELDVNHPDIPLKTDNDATVSSKMSLLFGTSCDERCLNFSERWMEKLEGCVFINPLSYDADDLRADLIDVCKRGCDKDNPLGSTKALPSNPGTNMSFKDVLVNNNIYVIGICDELLIDFPMETNHDYFAYLDPESTKCACDQDLYNVEFPDCPENNIEYPEYVNCACDIEDEELRNQILETQDVPIEYRCNKCIDCETLGTQLVEFLHESYGRDMFTFNNEVERTLLTNFLNNNESLNLSYNEYLQFALDCYDINTGTLLTEHDVWQAIEDRITGSRFYSTNHNNDVSNLACKCDEIFQIEDGLANTPPGTYTMMDIENGYNLSNQPVTNFEHLYNACCRAFSNEPDPNQQIQPCNSVLQPPQNYTSSTIWTQTQLDIIENFAAEPGSPFQEIIGTPCTDLLSECHQICNQPYFRDMVFIDPCEQMLTNWALSNARAAYKYYSDSVRAEFRRKYIAKCMEASEEFEMTRDVKDYHFTLYYYDQAGNLTKTVPPAGVDIDKWHLISSINIQTAINNRIQGAKDYRSGVTSVREVTAHNLITYYEYNTLGEVVHQNTPDGGSGTFWYDTYGRLAVSQNSVQIGDDNYSYTLYDGLGRITEVGQYHSSTAPAISDIADESSLITWLQPSSNTDKTQVSKTYYDQQYDALVETEFTQGQLFLRNRVAAIVYEEERGKQYPLADHYVTHYSYDFHGNVDELIQELPNLGYDGITCMQYNLIRYEFDLLSGNVHEVQYKPGKTDQFTHRYEYDDDNRLTKVFTSNDGQFWHNDVSYFYYLHGPLARQVLGDIKVQGIDYAYTLQGWLKGVNSEALTRDTDIGMDAFPDVNNSNRHVAGDAFGFGLQYYSEDMVNNQQKDYTAIDPSTTFISSRMDGSSISDFQSVSFDLFNGNISQMVTSLPDKVDYVNNNYTFTPAVQGMSYKYDQLNRIKHAKSFNNFDAPVNGNHWRMNGKNGEDAYFTQYSYDPNGNIATLNRHSGTDQGGTDGYRMDEFEYQYNWVNSTSPQNGDGITDNQLNYVKDNFNQPGNSGLYSNDIDDQANTANYTYDALGNLISDYSEEIGTIEWTAYGKIKSITRSTGVKPNLEFKYDASGNRICKKVIEQGGDITSTYYVLDASGNTMATYTRNHQTTDLLLSEMHIYGAARLGVVNKDLKIGDETNNCVSGGDMQETDEYYLVRGERSYELSNHLGNVLVVISDRKKAIKKTYGSCSTWCATEYYQVYLLTVSDYYPFGMQMEERTWSAASYRFGFNGQEKDDDVSGNGGDYLAFKYRIHDARLGRFLSVDPLEPEYPWNSAYAFSENRVIDSRELEGLESYWSADGSTFYGNVGDDKSVRIVHDNYNSNAKNAFSKSAEGESKETSEKRTQDLNGLLSNSFKTFSSEKNAAIAFSFQYQTPSMLDDKEYASLIGKVTITSSASNGSEQSIDYYVVAKPHIGGADWSNSELSKLHGVLASAAIHTHGAWPKGPDKGYLIFSHSNTGSQTMDLISNSLGGKYKDDAEYVGWSKRSLYLAAGDGNLKVLTYADVQAKNYNGTIVSNGIPHDPRWSELKGKNAIPAYIEYDVEFRSPQYPNLKTNIYRTVKLGIYYNSGI